MDCANTTMRQYQRYKLCINESRYIGVISGGSTCDATSNTLAAALTILAHETQSDTHTQTHCVIQLHV